MSFRCYIQNAHPDVGWANIFQSCGKFGRKWLYVCWHSAAVKILLQFKVLRRNQADRTKYLAKKLPTIDQLLFVQLGCLFLREQPKTAHFVCAKRRKVRLIFQAILPFLTFSQNFCLDISSRIGTMVVVVILQNLKVWLNTQAGIVGKKTKANGLREGIYFVFPGNPMKTGHF